MVVIIFFLLIAVKKRIKLSSLRISSSSNKIKAEEEYRNTGTIKRKKKQNRTMLNLRICRVRVKVFVIMMFFMTMYLCAFYIVFRNYLNESYLKQRIPYSVNLKHVVVHLDFKGSPPKLAYLESILPLLRKHGVNGLLMEYEDMFPYEGKLINLSARNAYDKNELKQFITQAIASGFEIIPLVQTFGHLEYALKQAEFQNLREDPVIPDSICPSMNDSRHFLSEILGQVIHFHSSIRPLKYIHVGCDEVFNLNQCEQCRRRKFTKLQIFASHFKFIANFVDLISPSTEILFWDDMLRNVKPKEFFKLKWSKTSPVYWNYTGGDLSAIHQTLYKYQQSFADIWVATAFKGADGPGQTLPDLRNRFLNHWKWMEFMLEHGKNSKRYSFKGIILTGWSRYTHMDPPCELLPASIPSLILNLIVIQKYINGEVYKSLDDDDENMFLKDYIQTDFNTALECYALEDFLEFDARVCNYDGAVLYNILRKFSWYKHKYQERAVSGYTIGPQTQEVKIEDLKLGYVNMKYVRDLKYWCEVGIDRLIEVEMELADAMSQYFDKYVVNEYVSFQVKSLRKKFIDLYQLLIDSYEVKVWPRGPTNIFKGLEAMLPLPGMHH